MYPVASDRLRGIKTFVQLTSYLREELDWPLNEYVFDELTFEYQPSELGLKDLDATQATIHQLRPLVAGQPWGIFFIEFDKKRLPVVVLRRILSHLVIKKRGSASRAERAAWNAGDLLFISAFGNVATDDREIAFAHFHQQSGDLPTLHVLGWDGGNTSLTLVSIEETLKARLCWPKDTTDAEAWRKQWSGAFRHRIGHIIRTANKLAEVLAILAGGIRDRAKTMLAAENERGPLTKLFRAFQTALLHDLTADTFADTYAQSITYGLLTAAFSRPETAHSTNGATLVADNVTDNVPVTNPFLKEMLETFLKVGGRKEAIDFDELGIQDVIELLRSDETDLRAIIKDFGNKNSDKDPVIYFYEHFLAAYDHEQKVKRGVFYTPQPVVSYIVRSAHELLQTEFGLEDGLASVVTWGEMAEKNKALKIPIGTKPKDPFVQILDPATGTATFLVEIIDVIHHTLTAKWKQERLTDAHQRAEWNDYVPKHLLPRLHGYELMMAPYAIAHMKIGLKLHETGYGFASNERVRIYLTNALEPPSDDKVQRDFEEMAPALAQEAKAVNAVKRHQRFTVVIGNPPYSVSSWNTGGWITNLAEDYKRTVRGEESQIQSLSNDYIKFLRLGEWYTEQTGVGILGFITGHGYLHGTQARDLRRHLGLTFDRCYCLDLHGSVRRTDIEDPEDEPVFGIMTGVAIILGLRTEQHLSAGMTVSSSLTGRLEKKMAFLRENTAAKTASGGSLLPPRSPYFFFASSETTQSIAEEYQRFLDLPELFGTGNRRLDKEMYWATGCSSRQDDLAISFSRSDVHRKMEALAASLTFEELNTKYDLCTTAHWNWREAKNFARSEAWQDRIVQIAYRPMDRRWTVFDENVFCELRRQVMSHLAEPASSNLALISSRAVNDLIFAHCFVTRERVDRTFLSSKTSTNAYVFPLFFHHQDELMGGKQNLNFSPRFLALLAAKLELKQVGQHGLPDGLSPEDVFQYVYALLHSPGYRSRYAEFLKIEFPRLALTGSLKLFSKLSRLGGELVSLHLLESPKLCKLVATYSGSDNPEVEKIAHSYGTVWLNKAQTRGFRGVPEAVWTFRIGGYQVCEKWLKDRKGRSLSKDDIVHYTKIVAALSGTIRLMAEIDATIEKHGGWPAAFSDQPVLPVKVLDLKPQRELVKLHPAL